MSFWSVATPFAVFQTVRELLAIARASTQSTRARILDQMPVAADLPDLDQLIGDQEGRLTLSQVEVLHPPLLLAAVLPNDDYDAFITSTALLLVDRLQEGAGNDTLSDHWEAVSAHYATAPRPVAVAIRRGFALCEARGLCRLVPKPNREDLTTLPRAAVIRNLREVARDMVPEDLHLVASSDGMVNFRAHRDGLKAVLKSDTCLLPQQARHVPGEVIDIASHVPGPGFAQATALLLIESIIHGDKRGHAAHRWASVARHYGGLDVAPRGAILSGYRHLWESQPSWNPYATWPEQRIPRQGFSLPLTI